MSSAKLPVQVARKSLIEEIRRHDVLIIIGETASGKTTQVPQFVLDENINHGKLIAVTQPRRVAAISLANRVAQERDEEIGDSVGYIVRFEERVSGNTKLKYMTDGILLREAMNNSTLDRYSVVILDEVHERTVNTDILLGILKSAQALRNESGKKKNRLKIIIMSATIDTDNIMNYFDDASAVYVEGRLHKVNNFAVLESGAEYLPAIFSQVLKLHKERDINEHMLVFLPGQDEITSMVAVFKKQELPNFEVYPLYSALSYEAQLRAISRPKKGIRRLVISTNIAETSLTIPGVRIVMDSGYVKRKVTLTGFALESLQLMRISRAESHQRAGRAGRERDGECYRFYSSVEYEAMEKFPAPEITRANVSGVVLQLLKLGIKCPSNFDWLDSPSEQTLVNAMKELKDLGAITRTVEPLELTPLGNNMAATPLDPKYAKVLLFSPKMSLLEPIATILGVLSSEPIMVQCAESVEKARSRFYSPDGDLITYINIMKEFRKSKSKVEFCKTYKFNLRALQFAKKVRLQLLEFCHKLYGTIDMNVKSHDMTQLSQSIRQLFVACLPLNVAQLDGDVYRSRRMDNHCVQILIHPVSVMSRQKHRILHFIDITQLHGGINYITHVSYVDPAWGLY